MSFSATVKDELSRLDEHSRCCMKSELAGIMRAGAAIRRVGDADRLMLVSENAPVSRHIFALLKLLYGNPPDLLISKTHRFRDHAVFRLDCSTFLPEGRLGGLLADCGIRYDPGMSELVHLPYPIRKKCCRRAYVRGCFLASGSMSDPDRAYHLEVSFPTREVCEEFRELLESYDLKARIISRKGHWLTYLKEGQEIVDFLNVAGAHAALMHLENIRILKDVRNNVNRIVNCETANLEKTVNASMRQVEKIRRLAEHVGLESLPPALREVARLRLENSEVTLLELGAMLSPPLTKSGVNHRLRKLESLADEWSESHDRFADPTQETPLMLEAGRKAPDAGM